MMKIQDFLFSRKGQEFLNKHQRFFLREQISNAEEFVRSLDYPVQTQKDFLLTLIQRNKDTRFGRKHHFSEIKNVRDFQKNIPILGYNDLRPYIEKVIDGKTNALFSQKPLMFLKTSGTTDKPKYIPVTKESKKDNRDTMQIWVYSALIDHPNLAGGTSLIISSPKKEGRIGKYNFTSYSGFIRENQPAFSKLYYALPSRIYEIEDEDLRYYTIARVAIEQNLTMFNTANSSTILNFAKKTDEEKENLIKGVRDGTFNLDVASRHDQEIIKKLKFKPNPERARELSEIVEETGNLFPKDYWENLVVIGCWKGGSQSIFYSQFGKYFGDIPVRDLGILASEGRMTIPLSDEGGSGILDIKHSFFEFISEEQMEKSNPEVLTVEQLEKDKNYFILITNNSGLYRYDMGDRIKVTGFYKKTPELCFLDRGKYCSSITGEKITEHQTILAMKNICSEIETFILHPAFENHSSLPHYHLLIEESVLGKMSASELQTEYDEQLRKINPEYDSKRKTRLAPPEIKIVPKGTFDRIKAEKLEDAEKLNDSQYKHQFLVPELNYHEKI